MEKLLIVGIDTLVGANLALALEDGWDVVGLAAEEGAGPAGCRTLACDFGDVAELSFRALQESPAAIVYCGPLARSSWDLAGVDSIDGPREAQIVSVLAGVAQKEASALAVISTDAVFAGPRMFHAETASTNSTDAAALAARTMERALTGVPALLVRCHPYGWSPAAAGAGFAQRLYELLGEGRTAFVDAQRYATPILASDLGELVGRALAAGLRGVWHLSGAERTNQHRFAAEMAVAFGLTGRQVLLAPPLPGERARPFVDETSLNTRAARQALGVPLPMLREGLARLAAQAENGYRQRLQSGAGRTRQHQHAA